MGRGPPAAGFERFFLYDNGSTDDHLDVLAPYIEDGLVTLHDWPMPFLGRQGRAGAIIQAFEDCLGEHRDDARWIAFLDLDEFMFSPTGSPLTICFPSTRVAGRGRRPGRVRPLGPRHEARRVS